MFRALVNMCRLFSKQFLLIMNYILASRSIVCACDIVNRFGCKKLITLALVYFTLVKSNDF